MALWSVAACGHDVGWQLKLALSLAGAGACSWSLQRGVPERRAAEKSPLEPDFAARLGPLPTMRR